MDRVRARVKDKRGVRPAAYGPRRAVAADHWRADRAAADRRDTGHPVPLPRRQDPQPLAPARTRLTQEPWRARCVERRTAVSASGLETGQRQRWNRAPGRLSETVALLAARSPKLRQALRDARQAGRAYLVIDGTFIPIDRVAADRPFCSGKHHNHRMTRQGMSSP